MSAQSQMGIGMQSPMTTQSQMGMGMQSPMSAQSNLQYTLPPNMINQARMMQQADILNRQNENYTTNNITKNENIKDMIERLTNISSDTKKKNCKVNKSNQITNINKSENFNMIDSFNNVFMENFASF
jgi:hypothetical protein